MPKKNNFFLLSGFLILVLVILPLGSWYYLKKGADFRIGHIKDMQPKGEFNLTSIEGISDLQLDSLLGKSLVAVVEAKKSNNLELETIELIEQFGDRKDFKVIRFKEVERGEERFFESDTQKHLWEANQSSFEQVKNATDLTPPYWVLIDRENNIRNFYSKKDFEKLILQTAMMLPIEQRKKIDLKRDNEI